jgi:hypothetical protein
MIEKIRKIAKNKNKRNVMVLVKSDEINKNGSFVIEMIWNEFG